ncbi:hypothetical protein EMIHUDRAFT_224338 [Emiliania huxleyi CCMP1516]|uniref:Uncharacterized protein n=2 Tax=Emiliania huxleyi TaxID=2903 RepID=A0A0D3KS40_EMIH1|nr:hypothetical protein EMIHUDRAFT_224338 [Emiliania huxleyi CCMP1516]EOD38575.1 hypothetical protein EMIHUDRAFT_224338 [Emiliania huxleyi CCMP1516]|eukprot:XP_005791004.1 hypothetical protein EMIHUDRAFT_224338 [Emiliania huxleyi CCMP1516]
MLMHPSRAARRNHSWVEVTRVAADCLGLRYPDGTPFAEGASRGFPDDTGEGVHRGDYGLGLGTGEATNSSADLFPYALGIPCSRSNFGCYHPGDKLYCTRAMARGYDSIQIMRGRGGLRRNTPKREKPHPRLAQEAARHADELLAEVEAEKRAKGKKGKKKKKGGGAGAAGPSQEAEEGAEAPSEAAEAAKKAEEERMMRLLEKCHEERMRFGITAASQAAASAEADSALEGRETELQAAIGAAEATGIAAGAARARADAAREAADAAQSDAVA